MLVKNVVTIVRTKMLTEELSRANYISTDNMSPNYSGITAANTIPSGTATKFIKGDILLSNIRPYFKKVWFADINGGCNADIICIRVNNEQCIPQYLYYQLITDNFINNYVKACKGAKMPRGDLNQLLDYDFYCPPYEEQLRITNILGSIDKKIAINKKKIEKLYDLASAYFSYFEKYSNKISTLDSLIDILISGDWGKETSTGNYTLGVNCLRGVDIDECKYRFNSTPIRFINKKNDFKLLRSSNLVVEISGGSPTQSTGRILYLNRNLIKRFANPIICSNFCRAIKLKNEDYVYWFYLKWEHLYRNSVMFKYEGKTSGIKNFQFYDFISSFKTTVLPVIFLNEFNILVEPIFERIQIILREIESLTVQKSTILPLLMNGQVTIG